MCYSAIIRWDEAGRTCFTILLPKTTKKELEAAVSWRCECVIVTLHLPVNQSSQNLPAWKSFLQMKLGCSTEFIWTSRTVCVCVCSYSPELGPDSIAPLWLSYWHKFSLPRPILVQTALGFSPCSLFSFFLFFFHPPVCKHCVNWLRGFVWKVQCDITSHFLPNVWKSG